MTPTPLQRGVALLVALAVGGCVGGSETGNPAVPTSVALSAHTSDRNVADLSDTTTGVFVDEAWVNFAEVEFEPADACDRDLAEEFALLGSALDLASSAGDATLDLPDAEFCRIEIEIDTRSIPLPVGAPPELEGASVVIFGRDPTGRPFELVSAVDFSLEIRPLAGPTFTLVDRADPRFVVSFDVATWLSRVNFAAATADTDGVVRITDERNGDLLDAFEERFGAALEAAFDRNGNGLYDAGETLESD